MIKNYLSIGEAAMKSRLSKIQIWMLIRNGIVRAEYLDCQTKINIDELDLLIDSNIYKSYQLSLPVEYRERLFSIREYLKELKNQAKPVIVTPLNINNSNDDESREEKEL